MQFSAWLFLSYLSSHLLSCALKLNDDDDIQPLNGFSAIPNAWPWIAMLNSGYRVGVKYRPIRRCLHDDWCVASQYRPYIVTLTRAPSNGTIPDPLRPHLPQDWGFITPTQNSIAIISRMGEATDFKFGLRIHPNKSPLKTLEKREHGRIQGLPTFFGHPLLCQEQVKLWTSNFVRIFLASIGRKAH